MVTIPAHVRSQALPAAVEAVQQLTPVLRRYPRASQAVTWILAAQAVLKTAQTLRARLKKAEPDAEGWTVTVKGEDDLYEHAIALMAEQSSTNWRDLRADISYEYDEEENGKPSLTARPAQAAQRSFLLGGHPITAHVETFALPARVVANAVAAGTAAYGMGQASYRSPEVVFTANDEAGQAAILEALQDVAARETRTRRQRKPKFHVSRGGYSSGWERRGELPYRPVDSVAVTDGQVQEVVDDILRFRSLEDEYVRRGVPFHRGYLLYGPPGTGKTSAVKAIAHAVDSDLYVVNLGSLNDTSLAELVSGVSRSKTTAILLLEDIDSFGAARQRDEDEDGDETGRNAGISTTGLLNALDGIETPHGLITILTTNHPEFLDDALVRPGRVDKKLEFGFPDDATVERHYTYFFGRRPAVRLYAAGRSGAELNEVFVAHMTDPEAAERALSEPAIQVTPRPTVTPRPAVVPARPELTGRRLTAMAALANDLPVQYR